jgi:hypothetical protein
MTLVKIQDGRVQREWEGDLVAATRTGHPLRWAEFEIWKLAGGDWLVHRTGRSRIYHRADTPCDTQTGRKPGQPGTVDDLPDDAVPCRYCRPPDPLDLADDEQIRIETPRHTVNRCATAADAVDALTRYRDRISGQRKVEMSEPVAELLELAAAKEPAFAAVPRPVDRIA